MRTQSQRCVKLMHYRHTNKGSWCWISLYVGPFNTAPLCNVFLLETPVKEGEKTCQFSMSHSHFFFLSLTFLFLLGLTWDKRGKRAFIIWGQTVMENWLVKPWKANKKRENLSFFFVDLTILTWKKQKNFKDHSLCGHILRKNIYIYHWSTDPCQVIDEKLSWFLKFNLS